MQVKLLEKLPLQVNLYIKTTFMYGNANPSLQNSMVRKEIGGEGTLILLPGSSLVIKLRNGNYFRSVLCMTTEEPEGQKFPGELFM